MASEDDSTYMYISIIQGIDKYSTIGVNSCPAIYTIATVPTTNVYVFQTLNTGTCRLEVGPEIKKKNGYCMYMYLKLIIFNFFCSHQFHHWHVNFLKVRFIYFYMYHQVKKKIFKFWKHERESGKRFWDEIWIKPKCMTRNNKLITKNLSGLGSNKFISKNSMV